jgi:hypothetical protein
MKLEFNIEPVLIAIAFSAAWAFVYHAFGVTFETTSGYFASMLIFSIMVAGAAYVEGKRGESREK